MSFVIIPYFAHDEWLTAVYTYDFVFKDFGVGVEPSLNGGYDVAIKSPPVRTFEGAHDELIEHIKAEVASAKAPLELVDVDLHCSTLEECLHAANDNQHVSMWFESFITENSLAKFIDENRDPDNEDADPALADVVHTTAVHIGWLPYGSELEPMKEAAK
ncbi:hypothetical protein [Novosphingobium sp.]|uniref:hypothetical protein n=1 Tax=Novosphingobium sp. TaxID=1874826 RepID=UPI0025E19D62|nr:hypothetical protein [Novosphingobium sp.]